MDVNPKQRRRHSAAFKAQVLAACAAPGASVAAVARSTLKTTWCTNGDAAAARRGRQASQQRRLPRPRFSSSSCLPYRRPGSACPGDHRPHCGVGRDHARIQTRCSWRECDVAGRRGIGLRELAA